MNKKTPTRGAKIVYIPEKDENKDLFIHLIETLKLQEETHPYKLITSVAKELEEKFDYHKKGKSSKIVSNERRLKEAIIDLNTLTDKSLTSCIYFIFQKFNSFKIVKKQITLLFNNLKAIESSHKFEEINKIIKECIKLQVDTDKKSKKSASRLGLIYERLYPDNCSIAIDSEWKVIESEEEENQIKKDDNSPASASDTVSNIESKSLLKNKTDNNISKKHNSPVSQENFEFEVSEKETTNTENIYVNLDKAFQSVKETIELKNDDTNTSLKKLIDLFKVHNILKIIGILLALVFVFKLLNTNNPIDYENSTNTINLSKKELIKPIFPKNKSKDTLYILITKFEQDDKYKSISNMSRCVGCDINTRIDQFTHSKKMPIKFSYEENIKSPKTISDAKKTRKKHNADILIWGINKRARTENNKDKFSFKTLVSKNMDYESKKYQLKPEQNDNKYNELGSFEIDEKEYELNINGVIFENWLSNMVFLKIEKKKPEFFNIDKNLSDEEKSKQFVIRSSLFASTRLISRVIKDLDSALICNPNNTEALENKVYYSYGLTNYLKKENDLTKLIQLNPENINYYKLRSEVRYTFKHYKLAEEDCNKIILIDSLNPDSYIFRGRFYQYEKTKNYDLAEEDYSKAIMIDSLNINNYTHRANFYRRSRKDDNLAEKDYSKAIKIDPKNPNLYIDRANIYSGNYFNRYDLAKEDYDKAVELAPFDVNTYSARLHFYQARKKYDLAEKDYDKIISLDSLNPLAYLNRASFYEHYDLKKYELAEDDYDKAIELDSLNPDVYISRANFFKSYKRQKYNLARDDYNKAVDLDSLNPNRYLNRAQFFENNKIKEYKLAQNDYDKAVKLDSLNPNRYIARATFLQKEEVKEYELAKDDYNKAIELAPHRTYTYIDRAKFYQNKETENYDLAKKDYTKAIQIASINQFVLTDLYLERAEFYEKYKQYNLAEGDYDEAINLDNDNISLYNKRINFYLNDEVKKHHLALKDYEKIIRLDSLNPHNYVKRAIFLGKINEYKLAENDYNKAIKLDPLNSFLYIKKAEFYKRLKQYNEAEQSYNKAIELSPSEVSLYYSSSQFYRYALKNDSLAIKYLSKIISLEPLRYENYVNRANSYINNKKFNLALKDYTHAINLDSMNTELLVMRGELWLYYLEKYDSARKDFSKAILLDSINPNLYEKRAKLYESDKIKEYDLAEKDYTQAILLDSLRYGLYLNRASIYRKRKDYIKKYKLAVKDYKKATSLTSNSFVTNNVNFILTKIEKEKNNYIDSLLITANKSYWNKDYLKSNEYYSKIIDLNPEHARALNKRAYLSYKFKDYSLSKEYFLRLIELDSIKTFDYKLLGRLFFKEGKYKETITYISKFIDSYPNNPGSYNLRGLSYDKLGEYKKAELDYKKAIKYGSTKYYGYHVNLIRSYLVYQYWYLTLLFSSLIITGIIYFFKKKRQKTPS